MYIFVYGYVSTFFVQVLMFNLNSSLVFFEQGGSFDDFAPLSLDLVCWQALYSSMTFSCEINF